MVEFSVAYFMNLTYSMIACFACYAYERPLVTLVVSFFMALILIGHVHLSKLLGSSQCNQLAYDYGNKRGPHSWPSCGPNQSPININTLMIELLNIREHLIWNHYDELPTKVTLENNGRTVILKAEYADNAPTISGADLLQSYIFQSLCFHWSFWDTEGSEHSIDNRKFPLEIQATHKTGRTLASAPPHDSLVVAYLFEISAHNQFLDPVILNLHRIQKAGTVVEISPFPLAWLCYPFKSGFYSYGGSRSVPPCEEGVEWFIFSEPLAIGENQIREFRTLLSDDGKSRIIRNSRPVQALTDSRVVNFNQYEVGGVGCSASNDPLHLSEVFDNRDE